VCLWDVRFSLGVIRQPIEFDPMSREYDTVVVTDSPSYKKNNNNKETHGIFIFFLNLLIANCIDYEINVKY
jgi:hypothetical protein